MLKINLYGAPSSGKTTLASQIFAEMKSKNYHIAYVPEYSKDLVYMGLDMRTLSEVERLNILVKQFKRENILKDKVDFLVTDSPMILTAYYHQDPFKREDWSYAKDIVMRHLTENEIHLWLEPTNNFEVKGRSHDEKQSEQISKDLLKYLKNLNIPLKTISGTPDERLKKVMKIILNG